MARNKLASQVRRQQAERRDHRRGAAGADVADLAAPGPTPSKCLAAKDLLQEIRRLPLRHEDERQG